jgi:hypothetical protein
MKVIRVMKVGRVMNVGRVMDERRVGLVVFSCLFCGW